MPSCCQVQPVSHPMRCCCIAAVLCSDSGRPTLLVSSQHAHTRFVLLPIIQLLPSWATSASAGETAYGRFPFKSLDTMTTVARRTEMSQLRYHGTRRYGSQEAPPIEWIVPPTRRMSGLADQGLAEMFAYHAVTVSRAMVFCLTLRKEEGN
jgi:hypothetical protein